MSRDNDQENTHQKDERVYVFFHDIPQYGAVVVFLSLNGISAYLVILANECI